MSSRLNESRRSLASHLLAHLVEQDGRSYVPLAAFDNAPGITPSPGSGRTVREIALGNARNASVFTDANVPRITEIGVGGERVEALEVNAVQLKRNAGREEAHRSSIPAPHFRKSDRALAVKFEMALQAINPESGRPAHYIENDGGRFSSQEIAYGIRKGWIRLTTTESPRPESWAQQEPASQRYDVPDPALIQAAAAGTSRRNYVQARRDDPSGWQL